ncbi:uncharacterized protein LOC143889332 [Tasmannia lanceolata]|uniref:uncharacterized protein LOC143889332 n=1 Tax=Tasmannia lanceolata TaxID=3420 RepID=UPI004063B387
MASSAKKLSFLFLIFLVFSLQVEARESQFFSKAMRYNTQNEIPPVKKQDPTTLTPQNYNGYGLYGHETEKLPSTSTYNNAPYEGVKSYQTKQSNEGYLNNEYYNKQSTAGYLNNEYGDIDRQSTAGYHNNEHENKQSTAGYLNNEYYNKQSTAGYLNNEQDGKKSTAGYLNNEQDGKKSTAGYLNNEYDNKQYGMSDTRFLEKGRYFYDVNKKNYYQNGYESEQGHAGYKQPAEGENYGSSENAYEYNGYNAGYQNRQENEEDEYMP